MSQPVETINSLFGYFGTIFNPNVQQTQFDTYQAKESINFALRAILQIEHLQNLRAKAIRLDMKEEKEFTDSEISKLAGDINKHLANAAEPFKNYINI